MSPYELAEIIDGAADGVRGAANHCEAFGNAIGFLDPPNNSQLASAIDSYVRQQREFELALWTLVDATPVDTDRDDGPIVGLNDASTALKTGTRQLRGIANRLGRIAALARSPDLSFDREQVANTMRGVLDRIGAAVDRLNAEIAIANGEASCQKK